MYSFLKHFLPSHLKPSEQLSQSNKYMWPTVSDPSLQTALNQSINQSVLATDELKKCVHQADLICQHLDLSAAMEQLKRLEKNLNNMKKSIDRENLIPLPDEKVVYMQDNLIIIFIHPFIHIYLSTIS